MTQDEIIRMAREVWGERAVLLFNELERFAALVAAHEREKQAEQEPVVFYRCNGCGHAYELQAPSSCDCMEGTGFSRIEYYAAPVQQAEQEPVAVISESAIGLVKLHSNGACLPFGTPLYAAPVDAKAIRAEALEEAAKLFDCDDYRSLAAAIRKLKDAT